MQNSAARLFPFPFLKQRKKFKNVAKLYLLNLLSLFDIVPKLIDSNV